MYLFVSSLISFTGNICVKDKATVATRNMFPLEGRQCVLEVFDKAIADHSPCMTARQQNNRSVPFVRESDR